MKSVIEKEFGFSDTQIKPLSGYDNKNYKVSAKEGKYIFKTYTFSEDINKIVTAENEALLFLEKKGEKKVIQKYQH